MGHYDEQKSYQASNNGGHSVAGLGAQAVQKHMPVPEALQRADAAMAGLAEATDRLLGKLEAGGVMTHMGTEAKNQTEPPRPISCPMEDQIASLEGKIRGLTTAVQQCYHRLCV